MNVLVLEDDESRIKKFMQYIPNVTITTTAKECIEQLEKSNFDIVFLDHDLGGEVFVNSSNNDTGMEVVRWLCSHKLSKNTMELYNTLFLIHSLNLVAVENMGIKLQECGYSAKRIPFITIDFGNNFLINLYNEKINQLKTIRNSLQN